MNHPVLAQARYVLPRIILLIGAAALAGPISAQDSSGWAPDSDRHIVSIGHDVALDKGEKANDIVAVFGSVRADGDVSDSVVAVLGDAHVSGSVGQNTVAVLGDADIDSAVNGNVVAVLGSVRLGPHADVRGQVIEVLGSIDRSPGSVVQGGTVGVLTGVVGDVAGLHEWVRRCLFYARPLAPDPRLGWAWGIAFTVLGFYLLLAAIFREGLQRCIDTLDAHPGPSILAALIVILLVPALIVALVITVIGIAGIPFVWMGLFCAGVFGRVVALGWLGGRCLKLANTSMHASTALAVLLGGVVALALYMVPLLGFIAYALLGIVGFGAVIYTLLLAMRASRERSMAASPRASTTGAGGATPPPGHVGLPPGDAPSESAGTGPSSSQAPGGGAASPGTGPSAAGVRHDPGSWSAAAVDPHIALAQPRAGFWLRIAALVVDLLLVGFALSLFFHHGFRGTLVILAAYAAIMWKLRGTTVGGIVCDLQVVRLDGRPIDWGTAIVRALACFLSLAILGLGFIWIAIDPDHQAWHDKIAGTVVVRVAKGVALV